MNKNINYNKHCKPQGKYVNYVKKTAVSQNIKKEMNNKFKKNIYFKD